MSQGQSWPWLTVFLVALLTGIHWLLEQTSAWHWFWLDTERLSEPWRFISAHWVHTDWQHLIWNCAALLILGGWLEFTSRRLLVTGLGLGTAAVSIWFTLFAPTQLYCGLSGVLNSLLILAIGSEMLKAQANRDWFSVGLLVLLGGGAMVKVVSELSLELRWVSVGIWPSAPGAHATGLLAGAFYLLYLFLTGKKVFGERC